MSDPSVSVDNLSVDSGLGVSSRIDVYCPHCCSEHTVKPAEWASRQSVGRPWHCRDCKENMLSTEKASQSQLNREEKAIIDLLKSGQLTGQEIVDGLKSRDVQISLRQLQTILSPQGNLRALGIVGSGPKGYFLANN